MQSLFTIYLFILSITCYSQDSNNVINCFAVDGLTLRTQPSISANKKVIIPYGDKAKVVSTASEESRINGFTGNWIEVQYKDETGYIFDAYTSSYPVPFIKKKGYTLLKDYLFDNFQITSGNENFNIDDNKYASSKTETQFGSISYKFNDEGHDAIETVTVPNSDIQECFIVFTAVLYTYRNNSLNPKNFTLIYEERNDYVHKELINPDNSGEGYIYTYRLDKENHFSYIKIDFEWEAGGSWITFEKNENYSIEINHGYYSH
jgi:hypothetical protein